MDIITYDKGILYILVIVPPFMLLFCYYFPSGIDRGFVSPKAYKL